MRYLFVLTASLLISTPAWCQAGKRLSAREVFYTAPVEAPKAQPAQPAQAVKTKKKAAAPAEPASGPAGVIPVSYTAVSTSPLGLRYSILKRDGAESVEVDPGAVFRSGDRIRLRVEVNGGGYLYVIHRGSSGTWKPLFPSPEVSDNRVEKGKSYEIPSGYVFTFDEQPGEEKLFLVLSRQPEKDLDGLIYSLSSGAPKPADAAPKVLLAQNMVNIQDGMIDRMRKVYSRDLIIEKVDEPSKEKAVYVVNPSKTAEARVVADVTLNHK